MRAHSCLNLKTWPDVPFSPGRRATGATKKSSLFPKHSKGTPFRVTGSFKLGSASPEHKDEEKLYWNILKKRSSVVKSIGAEWRECVDVETGYTYFCNTVTGHSQWERPGGLGEKGMVGRGSSTGGRECDSGSVCGGDGDDDNDGGTGGATRGDETADGWEAIASPEGDVLYYYNYLTGEWTYNPPDAWDGESYGAEAENTAELSQLHEQENESMEALQQMLTEVKDLLKAVPAGKDPSQPAEARALGDVVIADAVEVTVVEGMAAFALNAAAAVDEAALAALETTSTISIDALALDVEPNVLVEKLEGEYASLVDRMKMGSTVEALKKRVSIHEGLRKRRTLLAEEHKHLLGKKLAEASTLDRKAEKKKRKEKNAKKREPRVRAMSVRPTMCQSGREQHMWRVLINDSKATGTTTSGATVYTHNNTGRVFSFDDIEGGSFNPSRADEVEGAVMTI